MVMYISKYQCIAGHIIIHVTDIWKYIYIFCNIWHQLLWFALSRRSFIGFHEYYSSIFKSKLYRDEKVQPKKSTGFVDFLRIHHIVFFIYIKVGMRSDEHVGNSQVLIWLWRQGMQAPFNLLASFNTTKWKLHYTKVNNWESWLEPITTVIRSGRLR